MAKKETTKNIDASTIVVNDELTNDPTVTNDGGCPPIGDCSDPNHECKCKPGHCPNKNCSSGHYWTEGTKTDKYLYHYDDDTETKLEDADHRKSNPKYEEPKKPEIVVPQPQPVTPNDCGPEVAEPWAHDELLKDEDGHTGLERELRLHCGVTYNVVNAWLDELKKTDDKNTVIEKIAWHIPTGGPKAIKVHHKAKIVEALKALK